MCKYFESLHTRGIMNSENNPSLDSGNGNDKPKWLTRKVYENNAERKKDFWLGVGIFFALNLLLRLCFSTVQNGVIVSSADDAIADTASSLYRFGSLVLTLLPVIVNIVVVVYFAFTRSRIALVC